MEQKSRAAGRFQPLVFMSTHNPSNPPTPPPPPPPVSGDAENEESTAALPTFPDISRQKEQPSAAAEPGDEPPPIPPPPPTVDDPPPEEPVEPPWDGEEADREESRELVEPVGSDFDEPPPLPESNEPRSATAPPPLPPGFHDEATSEEPPPLPGEADGPPLPPPPPRLIESEPSTPMELFLDQAIGILAIERGINARSRMKMEALAQSLELPSDQFEEAMASLQRGDSPDADPKAEAFRLSIGQQLPRLPQKILTPALERRAIEIAGDRYELSVDEARQIIVEECAAAKVQRISSEKAEKHVELLVQSKLGDAAWVDDESRRRLHAAAVEWGVTEAEVDAIIKKCTTANRASQNSGSRFVTYCIVGACIAVALVVGTLAIINSLTPDDPIVAATDDGEPATDGLLPTDGGEATGPATVADPPDWWSVDMTIARGRLIAENDEEETDSKAVRGRTLVLNQTASADPAQRSKGYEGVIGLINRTGSSPERRRAASHLLAQAYVTEPDDKAADELLDVLWSQLPTGSKRAPTAGSYVHSFWATDTIATAAADSALGEDRQLKIRASVSRNLRVTIDPEADMLAMRAAFDLALTRLLYRQLNNVATLGGKGLRAASFALADATTSRLIDEPAITELAQLRSRLTSASLKGDPDNWKDYQEAAEQAIVSSDAANVVELLEVYETTENEELRDFLGERMAARAAVERDVRGLDPVDEVADAANVEQVASIVREAFGIVKAPPPKTAEQRWRKLEPIAGEIIDRRLKLPTDNRELLQLLVSAARANLLAASLAQQETGFPLFDREFEVEPPDVANALLGKKPGDDFAPGERPGIVTESKRQKINDAARGLGRYQSVRNHATSLSRLRLIADSYDQIQNLTTEQAKGVAVFLLGPKNEEQEQKDVLEIIGDVARYRQVRFALIDELEETKWNAEQFVALINHLLKTRFDADNDSWRSQARGALLASILKQVTPDKQTDAKTLASLGAGYLNYSKFYRSQAALLRVPPGSANNTKTTAAILQQIINRQAVDLASDAVSDSDKQFAAELAHRMRTAEYLAPDDLRHTAFLQRVWLRVLAIQHKAANPKNATQVQLILNEVQQRDESANHVLKQLVVGEIALLRLWMLHEE